MSQSLSDYSDEQLTELLEQHDGVTAMARALHMSQSTLSVALDRRGIRSMPPATPARRESTGRRPRITLEAIEEGMRPPNNCRVRSFIEELDPDSQAVLKRALEYKREDLSARRLREIVIAQGFTDDEVPGVDAINAHRAGTKPCRCKG